jgi:putative inorganic carbon (hco3(-)) transporter
MPVRDGALLAFFIASLPICFVRPFYGILLWTIVAFLNPQSFIWGDAGQFPWAMAVALPTLVGFLLFSRGWGGVRSRETLFVAILWVWFTITTFASTSSSEFIHHAPDTWYKWSFVSKILLMALVTVCLVNTFERLRLLVIAIAGSFGFFVAKAFPFLILTGGTSRVYGPENSMVADNNDFGLALNMTLPLFYFLAQSENNRWLRRIWGALFVMTIPAIFFTYSRGALVGMLAVFVVLLVFAPLKQRLALLPIVALAVLIALIFAPDSWKHRMDPNREDAIDTSAQARLDSWAYARALAADHPIFGGGFDTFTPELFARYAPDARPRGPHSVYFQLLAEHGFPGLFLYLSMVLSCFVTGRRLAVEARRRGDHQLQQYANMFQVSFVGFLASGLFLGRAYFDYVFTLVACLAILKYVAAQRWEQEDDEEEQEPESENTSVHDGHDAVFEGSMG